MTIDIVTIGTIMAVTKGNANMDVVTIRVTGTGTAMATDMTKIELDH
jgi:hypothetical protein